MPSLGIDFGSHEFRLAISQPEGGPRYLGAGKFPREETRQWGTPLKLLLDGSGTAFPDRRLRQPDELAVRLLEGARHEASKQGHAQVTACAITVPCGYGARGRQHLQEAARMAGFENYRLVLEPMAVILANRADESDKLAMAFSWGESGCDILVARQKPGKLEEVVSRGNMAVSGRKLTDLVMQHLRTKSREKTGRDPELTQALVSLQQTEARRALHDLSSQDEVEMHTFTLSEKGKISYRLTRTELMGWIKAEIDKGLENCQLVLEKAHIENPQLIDELWLAGGITHIPYVREAFTKWWGHEPHIAEKESAALGAALHAGSLWDNRENEAGAPPAEFGSTPVSGALPLAPESPVNSGSSKPAPAQVLLAAEETKSDLQPFSPDEVRLISLLRQTHAFLEAGNIDSAKNAIQDALDLFNIHLAQVRHAEGSRILKQVRAGYQQMDGQPDSPQKREKIKELDGWLVMARNEIQKASNLHRHENSYRDALVEIEKLQQKRIIEVEYSEAEKARNNNKILEAKEHLRKILQLDPQHIKARKGYLDLLSEDLNKKFTELRYRRLNTNEIKMKVMNIRKIVSDIKEIPGIDLSILNDLKILEEELNKFAK